jgi:glycogen phosphorylase
MISSSDRGVAATGSVEPTRTGLSAEALRKAVLDNLACLQGRYPGIATPFNWYMALAYTVRDRMLARWVGTVQAAAAPDVKVACYLSAEFLIGPQLGSNLAGLGIETAAREAMRALGQDLDALLAVEEEPGLGNGGLGRLAACYMDSLATLEIPAIGYGIRYEFGIFDQQIRDGWQQSLGTGAPGGGLLRRLRRPHRGRDGRAGPAPRALDSRAPGQGGGL